MIGDPDIVRRWTRALVALRARRLKVRRQDPAAVPALDRILEESLRACDALLQDLAGAQLAHEHIHREGRAEALNRQHLLERMPIACIATDSDGVIQNANQPAADLFNISTRHLRGRLLLHFSTDRSAFFRVLQELPRAGGQLAACLPVRPRERGPLTLNALIVPETTDEPTSWLWFLRPVDADASGVWNRPAYRDRESA